MKRPSNYKAAIELFSSPVGKLREVYQLDFEPGREQRALIAATLVLMEKGDRLALFPGAAGTGKCLGRGTPVMKFDGSVVPVEEILHGDRLMGPDSTPRTVLSLAGGIDQMYKITPVKGDSWICTHDHILTLTGSNRRKGQTVDMRLCDWLELTDNLKKDWKLFRAPVTFPEQEISYPARFVGLWLGDGAKGANVIYTDDQEVIDYCVEIAPCLPSPHECVERQDRTVKSLYFKGAPRQKKSDLSIFRKTRMIDSDGNKVIPPEYLYNLRQVRLELLAGLIDSDGSLSCGGYEFSQRDTPLVQQVLFLARSLGLAAYESDKIIDGETYKRVFISGDISEIPCLIWRKQAEPRKQIKRVNVTGFKAEPVGREEFFGFELDKDRRFLLGDFTVTHNTTTLKVLIKVLKDCGKSICVATPTHKAASRAREAMGDDIPCGTIHRIIYAGAEELIETKEVEVTDPKTGEKTIEIEKEEFGEELLFNKRESGTAEVANILLIDESSMIGESLAADMWDAIPEDVQVIAIGDPHQLPPVMEKAGFPLDQAPIELTEVYRQADGSPVLQAATCIRQEGVPFTYSRCGANWKRGEQILKQSRVSSKWQSTNEAGHLLAAMFRRCEGDAAAIVGTHRSRVALNDSCRSHLGFGPRSEGPGIGERLISRGSAAGIHNSDMVKVLSRTHKHFGSRFGDGWVLRIEKENGAQKEVVVLRETWNGDFAAKHRGLIPRSIREDMEFFCQQDFQKYGPQIAKLTAKKHESYTKKHKDDAPKWLGSIWHAEAARSVGAHALYLKQYLGCLDTGYAITCHAAQGSQYQEIVVVADMVDFIAENDPDQVYRWSYTALTRAVSNAIVIRKSRDGGWN